MFFTTLNLKELSKKLVFIFFHQTIVVLSQKTCGRPQKVQYISYFTQHAKSGYCLHVKRDSTVNCSFCPTKTLFIRVLFLQKHSPLR